MKLVLQRVSRASVRIDGNETARIERGLLVLFGAEKGDAEEAVTFLAEKTAHLRIFPDAQGKMNLSCKDIAGEVLVVSQFTLAGDCSRGRRPGFDNAAPPAEAEALYRKFVDAIAQLGLPVQTGTFGEDMQVELVNDGPVTFILKR